MTYLGSCGIIEILLLKFDSSTSPIFTLLTFIDPVSAFLIRKNAEIKVLFPAPVLPTTPILDPLLISKERSLRAAGVLIPCLYEKSSTKISPSKLGVSSSFEPLMIVLRRFFVFFRPKENFVVSSISSFELSDGRRDERALLSSGFRLVYSNIRSTLKIYF